jgi:endonuclease-3
VPRQKKRPISRDGRAEERRLQAILDGLDEMYPDAECELHHQDAFQLLVATILSAQCTDKRVNMVTPVLFARFPDPAALAAASIPELEDIIRSTGFFRNKAKNLKAMAQALVDRYGAEVPRTMAELVVLPGVARKTANVVLGTAYGIADGVVVDTHVARLSARLALSDQEDPGKIERDLMARLPRDRWVQFSHQLIWHGRRRCMARKPLCGDCVLSAHCPAAFTEGAAEPAPPSPRRRAAARLGRKTGKDR